MRGREMQKVCEQRESKGSFTEIAAGRIEERELVEEYKEEKWPSRKSEKEMKKIKLLHILYIII